MPADIIASVLGGAAGAITRLAPEVLKFFDRKNERKHELALGEQQRQLVEVQGKNKLETATLETQASQFTQAVSALQAAYNGQKSGVAWVDALSSSVRPVVTYGFALAFLSQKFANPVWDETDSAIFAAILNFWFLGRVFEKGVK